MKLPKRLPVKTILISATVIGMGAGATLYMVQDQEAELNKAIVSPQKHEIKAEGKPEVTSEPVLPVQEAPAVIEPTVNPTEAPNDVEEPVATPNSQLFANEMRSAGIEEKDFEAAYALFLNQVGWRLTPTPEHQFVWRLAFQLRPVPTLTEKLQSAKRYIDLTYGGDFNKALESVSTRGNF